MRVPVLAGITEAEAVSLYEMSEKICLKNATRLVEAGQTEQALYVVLSVQGRVGRSLMDMATPLHPGEWQIKGKLTHAALADKVGAPRETVGKALKDLEAKGFFRKTEDGSLRLRELRTRPRE